MIRRALFLAIFASAVWVTLPRLLRATDDALSAKARSSARRDPLIVAAHTLPKDKQILFVATGPGDVDLALFANYELYPVRSRVFSSLDEFRQQAMDPSLFHGAFVSCDGRRSPPLRVVTYGELRAVQIRKPVVHDFGRLDRGTEFVIPVAVAADGPVPDRYTTEALLENRGATPVDVRLEMFPSGHSTTIRLLAGERRQFVDLVYEAFSDLEQGWMRVEASAPIASACYFVNRGRGEWTRLPSSPPHAPQTIDVPSGWKLWEINTTSAPVPSPIAAAPHALVSTTDRAGGVSAEPGVWLFATKRLTDGRTRFLW